MSSFVPEIVEADGTCTVTATQGSATVSDRFSATASATTTECGSVLLTSPQLTTGIWAVTVAYASATSAGTSTPTTVVIP